MEGLDRMRRRWRARRSPGGGRGGWLASLALGAALAALCVGLLEARLRPMAVTIAQAQLQNDAARLVERVLDALEGVGVLQLRIPLGSLLDLDVLWGLGPSLKVHAMAVGTADARFSSSFSEAGVNQTLHRIELELTVPMTLLLPGGPVETESVTRLCVAETVIVGRVPDAYLQMERPGGG